MVANDMKVQMDPLARLYNLLLFVECKYHISLPFHIILP
jgi:hypothetical protein